MTQLGRCRHTRADNIETDLQVTGWRTWIGLIWLRTGTSCSRTLKTRWTFGFDKMCSVCRLSNELLASQEGPYAMQLSSQSFGYLSLDIQFLFPCITEEVFFLCTLNHRTLTMLSSIMQNISSKSLYYNSGTLTARRCRIFSNCSKVANKNLTQLKTFDKCLYIWVFSLLLEENILVIYMWLNMSHYTE
jgi:hypothetical protein